MAELSAEAEPDGSPQPTRRQRSRRRRRRRVSVVGLFGELLITAGVLVLLFLGWQVWWNSAILAGQQTSAASQQAQKWLNDSKSSTPRPTPSSVPGAVPDEPPAPPVMQPVGFAQALGVIYVPRFGDGWKRIIRESVDVQSVLNSYDAGVGHYPKTQMPGEVGNFAIAAHDTGYGNAFLDVSKLQLGDKIYIQTKDGFYTYEFRNYEYVQPNAVNVLLPVPRVADAKATSRLITLTTCNPPYHAQERIAAYGVYDSFSAAPPAAIAAEVTGG